MPEKLPFEEKKIARRSILSGATMLGGGALLSAAIPQAMLKAVAETVAGGEHRAILTSVPESVVETSKGFAKVKFSEEFLSNKVFQDLALNFDPPHSLRVDGKLLESGALVQPDGSIRFCIFAPRAQDITLKFSQVRDSELTLKRQSNGVFEGVLDYEDNHTGPLTVDVYVDGMIFLDPFMPIHWSASRPHNFIEVPDAELSFMHIKNVPHGTISREIYWADAIKSWERRVVYTPPEYMKSTKDYPVLYLQHGGGENEIVWEYCGHIAYILDNLIAVGKAEPFVVVMNNNMLRYKGATGGSVDLSTGGFSVSPVDDAFEKMLIEDCIPYMEQNYRLKRGKWHRALGGLSMGSMMSCDIAFKHPEMFGSLGTFTASMTNPTFHTTYERPYPAVMKDRQKFAESYKVYYRSTTPSEDHFPYFTADDKICADAGIDKLPCYHRIVYSERTTKWNSWRKGLRDYAQLLFR